MPFAGNVSAVSPGEVKSFTIDFSAQLATGETIASVTSSTLAAAPQGMADTNAPNLLQGSPAHTTTAVSQFIGATSNGFQAGALYIWTVTVLTSQAQTLVAFAHIPCTGVS